MNVGTAVEDVECPSVLDQMGHIVGEPVDEIVCPGCLFSVVQVLEQFVYAHSDDPLVVKFKFIIA